MDYENPVTPLFPQQPQTDVRVGELLSPTPGGVLDSLLRSDGYWRLLSTRGEPTPADSEMTDNVISMVRGDKPELAPLVDVAIACR